MLAATSVASVHLTLGFGVRAYFLESSSVFVIGADTSELTAVFCSHAFDVDVTLALLGALDRR